MNATGGIDQTGDQRIDGTKTKTAAEFVHALAKSERVEQVFVRHVFRFFTGRNENLGDGPACVPRIRHTAKAVAASRRWLLRF